MTARRHIPVGSDIELDELIEELAGGGGYAFGAVCQVVRLSAIALPVGA